MDNFDHSKKKSNFIGHEAKNKCKNLLSSNVSDNSNSSVCQFSNTFSLSQTPTRKKVDILKTFNIISKHLIPSQLLKTNFLKSKIEEQRTTGSNHLKRKSDSNTSTLSRNKDIDIGLSSSKLSYLKSTYSTESDKKSPSSYTCDKEKSSSVDVIKLCSNDFSSFNKLDYSSPKYDLNGSIDDFHSFSASLSGKNSTNDDFFECSPVKKRKLDSNVSTSVHNRRVSFGNPASDLLHSDRNVKNENLILTENQECLFSRRSSTPRNSECHRKSSSWEVSPRKGTHKRKSSDGYFSCHSSWDVTADVSLRSTSSELPSKKESTRVVFLRRNSDLDGDSFEHRPTKKAKHDTNKSISDNRKVSFVNSTLSNSLTGKDFLSTSLSPIPSSYVVYDECNSEEEMNWNVDPFFKRKLSSLLNTSRESHSSRSSSNKCGDYSTCKSEAENDTFVALPHKRYKDDAKSSILRRIKKELFTHPLDLKTISNVIDLRLISKHDNWIYSTRKKTIFILGDSHTRFLVNGMEQIFPGFRIYTLCKPSANTEQVFSGVDSSISELTKKDFLILFCGTNDMWDESTDRAEECMAKRLKKIKNTNVLVCNVPRNYSESETSHVQNNITSFNKFLKKTVNKFNNTVLVNLNRLKKTIFFTKHGLHFNGIGKVKICEILSHTLVDVLDIINPK